MVATLEFYFRFQFWPDYHQRHVSLLCLIVFHWNPVIYTAELWRHIDFSRWRPQIADCHRFTAHLLPIWSLVMLKHTTTNHLLGHPTQLSADLGFAAIFFLLLLSSTFFVTYPPSTLNETQPKPAILRGSAIWRCRSEIWRIPSPKNWRPKTHIFSTTL